MPSYELEGQIDSIDNTVVFDSGFQKREFVVETVDEKYPQLIKFQVVKDKCDGLDEYNTGDKVTVKFNMRGNKGKEGTSYEGVVFNSNECWAMDKKEIPQKVLDDADQAQVDAAKEAMGGKVIEDDSQLPF